MLWAEKRLSMIRDRNYEIEYIVTISSLDTEDYEIG